MAKLDMIHGEAIEKFRGIVDFYQLRGIVPVARSYPRKITPPYTEKQAQSQAVFALAAQDMSKLTLHILQQWRTNSEGKRKQWPDVFKSLCMSYWKKNRTFPPIATDYEFIQNDDTIQIKWFLFQDYLDPTIPEQYYTLITPLINIDELHNLSGGVFFTLTDDSNTRLPAPYIHFSL